MSPPTTRYEIALRGSDAVIRGCAPCTLVASIYRKTETALKTGTHRNARMQAEYDRMGGRGLLCKVIEPAQ